MAGFYVIWIPISANIPRFIITPRFNTDIAYTVNCNELYDNIVLYIVSYRKLVFLLTWWVVWALEPSWERYGVQRKMSLLWHRKRVNGQRFVHFILFLCLILFFNFKKAIVLVFCFSYLHCTVHIFLIE